MGIGILDFHREYKKLSRTGFEICLRGRSGTPQPGDEHFAGGRERPQEATRTPMQNDVPWRGVQADTPALCP